MRVKFEIDSDNKVINVDDDYDNTEIKISNLDNGNKLFIININRELVLDGDERDMIAPIEEIE
tara:strand:- start:1278 stop:1466 length:189 start_codon:yes stop_codon:yes gene_type:complete